MLHCPPPSPFSYYFSLHRIAAAMSTRPPFRGARGRRSFSDHRVVSGDSHFQSVRDANFSVQNRHGRSFNDNSSSDNAAGSSGNDYRRVNFSYDNLNRSSGYRYGSNSGSRNNGGFRAQPQLQSYRPRAPSHGRPNQTSARPRPADFRRWEFAKHPPPPHSERFVVLSYNILADYLAHNHRALYWHIPRRFVSWDWRKRNILFELGLWSADIMCFQEVDRFHELEDDLKRHGYSGIWKMRTGVPVDGCAIFWRSSRFKLVYEECIEFNKLGMRDNVAQVCVLELLMPNQTANNSTLSESSEGPKQVVVCNIHVLYNPRRGEMKLGQVRVLLERAQEVSKKWDDAPVVLCGDFNSVPKSPLYDFISEQKLDISGIDRDKVSGQASAEIRPLPRQFGHQARVQTTDNVANPATNQSNNSDVKQNDTLEKQNASESLTMTDSQSLLQSDKSSHMLSVESPDKLASDAKEGPGFTSSVDSAGNDVLKPHLPRDSGGRNCSDDRLSPSTDDSLEIDTSGLPFDLASAAARPGLTSVDESNETNASLAFENLDEKLSGLSLGSGEIDDTSGNNEELGDDAEELSELNDEGDVSPTNLGETVLEDTSSASETDPIDVDKTAYDPSSWTPMEIATATGDSTKTVLEHSLKLRSTYTEVEDCSETRDSVGEPLVTSYNSCFMGTVDYIWRSEGLCTVKALAPIPKNVMQPYGGFPTKKWGSDHIALATELAFTK